MQAVVQSCKKKMNGDVSKNLKMTDQFDQLLSVAEELVPQREVRDEVDKVIWQWLVEWDQGTQDDEAKWL